MGSASAVFILFILSFLRFSSPVLSKKMFYLLFYLPIAYLYPTCYTYY